MIDVFGLIVYYQNEKGEKGEVWVENLKELISVSCEYEINGDEEFVILVAFLDYVVLELGEI